MSIFQSILMISITISMSFALLYFKQASICRQKYWLLKFVQDTNLQLTEHSHLNLTLGCKPKKLMNKLIGKL
jgi:hypothetical protein